jgi:competence protein ComEC
MMMSLFIIASVYYLNDTNYINFLDVNQGDSAVVRVNHKTIVVDCYQGCYQYLVSNNYRTIEYLIITHSDFDHAKEAQQIIDNLTVKQVIINAYDQNYQIIHHNITKIGPFMFEDKQLGFSFLHPVKYYGNDNDNSLVMLQTIDHTKILFMGDVSMKVEKDLLITYPTLKVDIIKLSHHGSDSASDYQFLKQLTVKHAIISAGMNNTYEHPSPKVLKTLESSNIKAYNTATLGSIQLKIKKKRYQITTPFLPN